MTDIERRALLGDAEAQRECTEKGIVLRCPFCGNPEVKRSSSGYLFSCRKCDMVVTFTASIGYGTGLLHYNARTAPPIGRCQDCEFHDTFDCPASKTGYTEKTMKYCSWFEPKGGERDAQI